MYESLATLTFIIHFLFITFVVFGGLLFFIKKWMIRIHLSTLIYGIYVEFTQSICPLTYLENFLLQKAKLTTYSTSFIQNYLFPIIYPANLTKDTQINLGIYLIILNAVIYAVVVIKYKKINSN